MAADQNMIVLQDENNTASQDSGKMKVLIVDDSSVARLMIAGMLEPAGHQIVAQAENMDAALKAYQTHKPDVVTLDLALGPENGMSVLQALLKIDPKAKVIVVSANSQRAIQKQVLSAGAAGFVAKPFGVDELEAALKALQPS